MISLLIVPSKFEAGEHWEYKQRHIGKDGEDAFELIFREHDLRKLVVLTWVRRIRIDSCLRAWIQELGLLEKLADRFGFDV